MDYTQFMNECKAACRERNACQAGYAELLRSGSVEEILTTVVHNWNDVFRSKYADIVAKNVTRWFDGLEAEFHAAGFYVNEETDRGIAIVSHAERQLRFGGRARVYVFAGSHVIIQGSAQVYCRDAESEIEMYDESSGKIEAGRVWAHDWATLESHGDCTCYDRTTVYAYGGTLTDHGHRRLITHNS